MKALQPKTFAIVVVLMLAFSAISIWCLVAPHQSFSSSSACRVQGDIMPRDFKCTNETIVNKPSTICGIFGDITPKDWDEWFEDDVTATS